MIDTEAAHQPGSQAGVHKLTRISPVPGSGSTVPRSLAEIVPGLLRRQSLCNFGNIDRSLILLVELLLFERGYEGLRDVKQISNTSSNGSLNMLPGSRQTFACCIDVFVGG